MTEERYNELVDLLNKANYEYHVLDNATTLTDQQYDNYLKELYEAEKNNPSWKREDSPTTKIGGVILDKFEKLTTDLVQGLPAEIKARQQQYEYYRDKLLTFPRKAC